MDVDVITVWAQRLEAAAGQVFEVPGIDCCCEERLCAANSVKVSLWMDLKRKYCSYCPIYQEFEFHRCYSVSHIVEDFVKRHSNYYMEPTEFEIQEMTPPLLPIPLPISSPPLPLPSTDHRADVPEVTLLPQKRLCIASGPIFKVGECSSAPTARPTRGFREDYGFVDTLDAEISRDSEREIGYGIIDVWVDPDEIVEEIPAIDVAELSQRMTNFVTTVRQDTNEIYGRLDDAQDDRRSHARTVRLMETKARLSCEAWVQSMDASDTACSEETDIAHKGTDSTEDTADSDDSAIESTDTC
ncbi:hypothetical protein Tco_0557322 [Tanacetum coccineum]